MSFTVGRSHSHRDSLTKKKSRRINKSRPATRTLRIESLESRELLAVTPQALLPDLTPWASQSQGFIYDWTIQGNDLRLTTAMANIGTGRMELRGGATHGSTQDVMQRIYEPNGTFTDVLAGTFTFHPEHGHIHFDGFAEFRLRSVLPDGGVGPIVAAGDKVSFCLLDVQRYDNSGPGSPFFLTCGQVQGISVGWADVYDRGLPGQSIDISGVANGTYWLEVVVDPDNHLLESNEDNNAVRIQINLQHPGGGGTITPDTFEPNNTFSNASILAPPEDHVYESLSIHSTQDVDFYRVTASASGTMAFRLAFQNSQGDVELEVLDASQNRIGLSDSTTNNERISFTAVAGQYYFARVYGYEGAINPNYTLTVDQPDGASGGGADQFEENDTFATARTLTAADQTYTSLSIDATNDDDYYRVVPTASGSMTVSLAFQHAQGDIDMRILSASQSQLGISDSTSNSEQFSWTVTAGQAYYIRIYGYQGAVNPYYSMTIDVPGAPAGIPADALEENDTLVTARSLAASDQSYSNLTINAANDDDYYSIVPTNSGALNVSLAFQQAQGNVELQILDASQAQLGLSNSTGNSEQLNVAVTSGQTYYVRVFGAAGATSPNYAMTVDVPAAPVVIPADALEENDTFATARSLAATDQVYSSLTINAANDDDFYSIVPTNSGTMNVSLAFQNAQGNVDLQVLNASQTQLGLSNSTGNSEQLSLPVTAGETYYVRVFGAAGATNPDYSLTIDVPAAPGGSGDSLEQNDSFATAHSLASADQTYSNLSIDAANDDDYYSIVAANSGTLAVSLAFQHSQGDVDMRVFNAAQTELGLSDSTTNAEQLSLAVTAGQTYYVRVYGFQGAVNPNYTMTVDVPTAPTPGVGSVTYLSTTGGGSLTSTDGSPSLSFIDADILKLTVQPSGQYGYQLHFDGSDVGLTTANEDVDAFAFLAEGSIVVSTVGSFSVPATGGGSISGNGEDLLRFVPTSLGATTAGAWSLYFDGSDVGLSGSAENIDAVAVLANGKILVSTTGAFSASGASGQDEDLFAFTPTTLGSTTAGSWAMYFDGSDVGLSTNDNEDVNALYVRETAGNPTLFLSTLGNFSVTGVSGANEDAFAFTQSSIGATTTGTFGPGLAFDGSLYGLGSFSVDGIHLVPPASPLAASAASTASRATTAATLPALATSPPVQARQAAQPVSTANSSATSNATALTAVLSKSRPASSRSTAATSSTGRRRQRIPNPAPASAVDEGLTVWDHIADSLDEIFRDAYQL